MVKLVSGKDNEKLKLDVRAVKRFKKELVDNKEIRDDGYRYELNSDENNMLVVNSSQL